jgi:hypothetical protein
MQQTSRGKFDRLQRTTAGFTNTRLDGYGLRCSLPTRPRVQASYPILVHRHTPLLHASFRPHLATTPLRFANPSPPSGWIRDLHPQTVEHARHTKTPVSQAWTSLTRFPHPPQFDDGLDLQNHRYGFWEQVSHSWISPNPSPALRVAAHRHIPSS